LTPVPVPVQAASVPKPAVRADLGEALHRLAALAAQVTLDLKVAVDVLAKLRDLGIGEVADLLGRRQTRRLADLQRRRAADAEDVREPDLEALVTRKVYAGDSCHVFAPNPVVACVAGSCK